MGGCSAPGCNSRSDLGVRLFAFPVGQERRRRWTVNSGRGNWTPTAGSRLCEKHFNESQFEANRRDGWRKLRPDAVPTVFDFSNSPRRPLKRRSTVEAKVPSKATASVAAVAAICNCSVFRSDLSMESPSNSSSSQCSGEVYASVLCLDSSHSSPKKHAGLKVQVEILKARETIYLSEIHKLKHQFKIMDTILSNTEKNLEKIFSPDQIHDIMFESSDE